MMASEKIVRDSVAAEYTTIGSPKMLYLGGTFYFAEYPVYSDEGKLIRTVVVDLQEQKVINPMAQYETNALPVYKIKKQDEVRALEAEKAWKILRDDTEMAITSSAGNNVRTSGSAYIPGVPLYAWYLGCAPTAAGMVWSYWDSHGYPNFPDNQYTLISELATAMGTSGGSTSIWNVDDGMNTVSQNHGYTYSTLHAEEDSWVGYSEVTTEVNAYRPFVLNMLGGGTAYGGTQPYGDHSVAVIGYESYPDGDYVVIQDTWIPLTARSLRYGNWLYANADYSRHN
jgi:hypothetical protein